VRAPVHVEVPHAAALASEDHLIFVLDDVHTARIRVDEQRTVTAAPDTTTARLRHHDIGHAFRVWSARLRRGSTAAAAATPAAASSAGGHAGQQLRGRYRRAEPVEASGAVRIDTNPVAFEV
jgi:hypothetical protein